MSQTIYIDYQKNGVVANAYSVKLGSSDGTYGIKILGSSTVVVANNTTVSNPSIGRYEYTFDPVVGITYQISWKVVPTSGETPQYVTQEIGPFFSIEDNIRAVADYRGTFIQGSTTTLFLKVTSMDGLPQDAENISIAIFDPSSILIDSGTPDKVSDGYYAYDWVISSSSDVGSYLIKWSYIINGTSNEELQEAIVADSGADSLFYKGRTLEFRNALESYIFCAQAIPVYFEQAKLTEDRRTFYFTFPRWNQTAGVNIYRNKTLITSGAEVNYFKGYVRFDSLLSDYDSINADYNFKWFSDLDLDTFLSNAVQTLNQFPPYSSYTLVSLPDRFIPSVIYKAATDAIRKIMLCLQFQEPQQVFGGSEGAQQAFSNFETLKKNYEEEWKLLFEQKKYGPYVGLTRTIVTPEFTLPGGRSRWFRYLFK